MRAHKKKMANWLTSASAAVTELTADQLVAGVEAFERARQIGPCLHGFARRIQKGFVYSPARAFSISA